MPIGFSSGKFSIFEVRGKAHKSRPIPTYIFSQFVYVRKICKSSINVNIRVLLRGQISFINLAAYGGHCGSLTSASSPFLIKD